MCFGVLVLLMSDSRQWIKCSNRKGNKSGFCSCHQTLHLSTCSHSLHPVTWPESSTRPEGKMLKCFDSHGSVVPNVRKGTKKVSRGKQDFVASQFVGKLSSLDCPYSSILTHPVKCLCSKTEIRSSVCCHDVFNLLQFVTFGFSFTLQSFCCLTVNLW